MPLKNVVVAALYCAFSFSLLAADARGVSGLVVDENHLPVAGADVSFAWMGDIGEANDFMTRTDADGHFYLNMMSGESRMYDERPLPLLVKNRERTHGGLVTLNTTKLHRAPVIKLAPMVRVHGQFSWAPLESRPEFTAVFYGERSVGWPLQYVLPLEKFGTMMPPGNYRLQLYGTDINNAFQELTIPAGVPDMEIPTVALDPTRLALHYGKLPPELHVSAARGAPATMTLADYKGKWVLLDFWGYWCPPCVRGLPRLIDFYDKHKAKRNRFEILAVHLKGKIGSMAALDEKMKPLITTIWNNRPLPFPIVLDYTDQTEANFGLRTFPTTLLISPDGILVKTKEDPVDFLERQLLK